MSELTTPIKIDIPGIGSIESSDLYLKSEADKVIEEKDRKIAELERKVDMNKRARQYWRKEWILEYKDNCQQKYKRCLAMAKACHTLYEKYSSLAADDANWEEEDYYFAKWRFFEKWKYKWLALAEEPTWAKFLQLIQKEAK